MKTMLAKKAVEVGLMPLALTTLYKYHSQKIFPEMIFKLHGRLMVDLDAYEKIQEQARDKHVREAARMRAV